jgi:putative FmdB family regulatory protein
MPTYDYKCSQCKYTFEYFQSMSAEPLTECPKCGGHLKRVIGTGAGTIFKGSGFYQTDYKNKSTKNNNSDKTENKPSSGEMKDKKADKK